MPDNPLSSPEGQEELERENARLKALVAELQRRMARYGVEGESRRMSGMDVSISEREELLLTAEQIAHMGSWVWDVEADRVSWSDELYRILDCDPEREPASAERFFMAIHPDDRERIRTSSQNLLASGQVDSATFKLLRKDGSVRYAQANGAVVFDRDGRMRRVVGTILDITERHQATVELAEAHQRLARAEKLELIGRLAGGIAHELNNIMTVIHGGAELLASGEPADSGVLGQLKDAVRSARDLTTRLLAFGRQSTLRSQHLDPNEVVRDTVRLVERILGEDAHVELALDEALPATMLDPHLTGQALINLVINARDAMPAGGRIVISTRSGRSDDGASFVEISVRDFGPGIAPDLRDKVFEPFFTTKEQRGSGLGLAMVQGAVEQQGGTVTLHSGSDGCEFVLRFPASATPLHPTPRRGFPRPDPPPPSRYRILVVEDQESLAYMVQRLLARVGHDVEVRVSPREALVLYRARGGEIDLVLSDVLMPEMSGMEMVEAMRAIGPVPTVLYMSGYGAEVVNTIGPDHIVVPKPFTKAELLKAIERTMASVMEIPHDDQRPDRNG